MTPSPVEKGDLSEIPFPKLLWKIARAGLTGKLDLAKGEVAKTVYFDGGHPVHAESNLLPETLGQMLVEDRVITSAQEQMAVVRSLEGQMPLGQALIDLNVLDAARVTEALRKNIAQKILDCFRWEKGNFTFSEENEFLERIAPLKMNPARLILIGVSGAYPFARIASDDFPKEGSLYRVSSTSAVDPEGLQLTQEEIRFLKEMKEPTDLSGGTEERIRKAYGLFVLGLLETADGGGEVPLDELVGATLLASLKPVDPPKPVSQIDPVNQALANEIATEHMRLTSLNHFELLDVPETATAVAIRDKFVDFAARYNPARFRTPELGEFRNQGEEIFLRGVKAFAALSDFDSKTKYLDKIKAERRKAEESGRKKPGEAFKITTKLLDADTQFQKGLKFLKERNFTKAIEFFEYAIDVDPKKASYVAHLGWATYNLHPERNFKSTEEILRRAWEMTPPDEWAAHYLGKFLLATERKDEGIQLLKRAAELAPKNPDIIRDARNVEKAKK